LQKLEEDEIHKLWDNILQILIQQMNERSVPVTRVKHLTDELQLILSASKGSRDLWNSVIDVLLVLLESDATIKDFKQRLPYNESTIYRALSRLEAVGFAESKKRETLARVWTINKERCPILYRASRSE
jgi:hypothetical protein